MEISFMAFIVIAVAYYVLRKPISRLIKAVDYVAIRIEKEAIKLSENIEDDK